MLPPEIEESLQEFDRSLNISIPLRHYWDYIDSRRINCKIQTEKDKAIQNFRQVADKKDGEEKRVFAETFHCEVDTLADAHKKKNEEFREQAHSLLKKRREDLCADFKSSTEAMFLRNQDMDFEAAEELLEAGKQFGKSYFEYHSNYGNPGSYNDERMKQEELLVQELNTIGKKLLKQRRRHHKSISGEGERKSHKEISHRLLKKRVEDLGVDLKSTLETKLFIVPDMDLKSLKGLIETGKDLAKNYFEYHSNLSVGKVGVFNEEHLKEQMQLEQDLRRIGNVIVRDQRLHLRRTSDDKARKLLELLKEAVLEMSGKVKTDSRQWNITKRKLKEKVQEIHHYVVENGSSVLSHGNNREIYTELLKLEAGEEITAEEFIEWTDGLSMEVKHDIECEMETPEMHFLESDSDEDAPKVGGNSELEYSQEKVKEEVLEMEGESSVLETFQDMDIDVKLEFDGLSLQTSCLKPDFILKPSRDLNLAEKDGGVSAGTDVRVTSGTMSLPENDSVKDFLQRFRKVVHSSLPLRHISQFYEDDKIREITYLEKENILKKFMEAYPNLRTDHLKKGLQNAIDELVKKNEDHKSQSESVFKKLDLGTVKKQKANAPEMCAEASDDETLGNEYYSVSIESEVARESGENECVQTTDDCQIQQLDSSKNQTVEDIDKKRGHQQDLEVTQRHLSKRLRQMPVEDLSEEITVVKSKVIDVDWNVPSKYGGFPLLLALRYGRKVNGIKKMLDEGANVNIRSDYSKDNAAHHLMDSLIKKRRTASSAVEILKLLLERGFNLINEGNANGWRPLFHAMEADNLNVELLELFFRNGADIMAMDKVGGDSVLFYAILYGHGGEVLQKIMEFGGDPKHVNTKYKWNALHYAASAGNYSAMEILIDQVQLDVNAGNLFQQTPLHLLDEVIHWRTGDKFLKCLEILLRKGADFSAKCKDGDIPLVRWIKYGYPYSIYKTLLNAKDILPITQEIASSALTAMLVWGLLLLSVGLKSFYELTQFFAFLVDEKDAKVLLKDESKWKHLNWNEYDNLILTRGFSNELRRRTAGNLEWKGNLIRMEAKDLGKFDFHTKHSSFSVPIEMVLNCLVACGELKAFMDVGNFLRNSSMLME